MSHLLDTNTCIAVLNGSDPAVADRLRALGPRQVALSSIVKAELVHGARRSRRVADNLRLLERFFAPFVSLPLDDAAATHAGEIRAELARLGKPIGPHDVLVAATARAAGLVVVTANVREFSRVPGLAVEDWSTPP